MKKVFILLLLLTFSNSFADTYLAYGSQLLSTIQYAGGVEAALPATIANGIEQTNATITHTFKLENKVVGLPIGFSEEVAYDIFAYDLLNTESYIVFFERNIDPNESCFLSIQLPEGEKLSSKDLTFFKDGEAYMACTSSDMIVSRYFIYADGKLSLTL